LYELLFLSSVIPYTLLKHRAFSFFLLITKPRDQVATGTVKFTHCGPLSKLGCYPSLRLLVA
jgi:hypothetical protein